MKSLEELGYQFDEEALRRWYKEANRELTDTRLEFYKVVAQFVIFAYEQGCEGAPLSELIPFLKPLINNPA